MPRNIEYGILLIMCHHAAANAIPTDNSQLVHNDNDTGNGEIVFI